MQTYDSPKSQVRLAEDVLKRMRHNERASPRDWTWWTGSDGPSSSEIKTLALAVIALAADQERE